MCVRFDPRVDSNLAYGLHNHGHARPSHATGPRCRWCCRCPRRAPS